MSDGMTIEQLKAKSDQEFLKLAEHYASQAGADYDWLSQQLILGEMCMRFSEADAKLAAMAEALKAVEWSINIANENMCPLCMLIEGRGHAPDCPIGQALSSLPARAQAIMAAERLAEAYHREERAHRSIDYKEWGKAADEMRAAYAAYLAIAHPVAKTGGGK